MTSSQFTIVIADDEPAVIDAAELYILRLAKKHGKNIKILKANSGSEVIKFAEDENVDAFFIDYMFKYGMTGDQIIQNIQDPFCIKFFILMSGWNADILENIIIKNHHRLKSRCKFLRKPYDALTFQASFLDIFSFLDTRLYPLPIHYVYNVVQNSKDGIARAMAMKDFFETLLKFSVTILMTDLYRQKEFSTFRARFKPNANLTYGAWYSWLGSLLDFYKDKNDTAFIPEILHFFDDSSGEMLNIIGKFKDVRDNELGHGFVKDDKWYEILANDYEKYFNSMYKNLQFLTKYTLIVPEKMDFLPDETQGYKYQVKTLMGSEMLPEKAELITGLRLITNNIYSYSSLDQALLLSPFIVYKMCPECESMRLYFLDRIQPTFITYNSFCNHRIEDKEAKVYFDQKYGFIFSNA